MKKQTLSVAAALVASCMVTSSCIGSFGLFNSYEKWQRNMTSSKIVNGIVGLVLQPIVGGICLTVDAIVLNTIEFWTGNSPVVASTQTIKGEDGRYYVVKTSKKGYEIKSPTGEVTMLLFNKADNSWTVSQNGVTRQLLRFNEDGTIQAYLPNGEQMVVSNDEAGLQQVRQATTTTAFYAQR